MPLPKKPVAVRLRADGLLSDCVAVSGAEVLVGRDILSTPVIVVEIDGEKLRLLNILCEGGFSDLDQVIDCVLVGVLFADSLDCVELISGDLHTPKLDDDVSVVCVI